MKSNFIKLIQPDDWHVHLREGDMLESVIKYSYRINHRCIVMPNLDSPLISIDQGLDYKKKIHSFSKGKKFTPLIPCYLTDKMDLIEFKKSLDHNVYIGAKLYPSNATNNSVYGVTKIENIFPALKILEQNQKLLLIHGEKINEKIDIFDREKYFIDEELEIIRKKFPNLKIVLEHVSSKYGADYVNNNKNIAATITPQHLMLTKKDVFFDNSIDPHNFCMPVVKEEKDLISLRAYATSGNPKFFLGTDSAPHDIKYKISNFSSKPGIFSSPCSIEIYTSIFEEENALNKLETFCSINGPTFYDLPINTNYLKLIREKWRVPEFTTFKDIKIKNFMGGKEINWKVVE